LKRATSFTHPLVRSLAWLIGSPVLLAQPGPQGAGLLVDDQWCANALQESLPFLQHLDRNPVALEARVAASGAHRLGRVAEVLVGFWLAGFERFELCAQNLAVRVDGRTLGEFDLVFRDRSDGRWMHWEMAVKFYLRRAAAGVSVDFVGPEGRDTLARKADHIFSRQLGLSSTAAGAAALAAVGASSVASRAFVKGWLFHSTAERFADAGINPLHSRGWWTTLEKFMRDRSGPERRFRIIERARWMAWPATCVPDESYGCEGLAHQAAARFDSDTRALMVAEFDAAGPNHAEIGRGFIVPDTWAGREPA
jgi:hypothetical protein